MVEKRGFIFLLFLAAFSIFIGSIHSVSSVSAWTCTTNADCVPCTDQEHCGPEGNSCQGNDLIYDTNICVGGFCTPSSSIIQDCTQSGDNTCTIGVCDSQTNSCVTNKLLDTTPPVTSNLVATKVINACQIKIEAKETDQCSPIKTSEYFTTSCETAGTGKTLSAVDGSYDELIEDVMKDEVNVVDGSINVYVRGQDSEGNWEVSCKVIQINVDCLPPEYPTCEVGQDTDTERGIALNGQCNPNELLLCGNNPLLTANVCDKQSAIQLAEYFIDQQNPVNWGGIVMQASDGNYRDENCEDVQATIDLSQLSEGTHYVELHGKDTQENWGKLGLPSNPLISFIKDTLPPVTTKTISFAGDTYESCDLTSANGHELTDGCYYVKSGITNSGSQQSAVNLGTAGDFVILAKAGITTTGATSIIGDIGVSPIAASAITGFGLVADASNQFSTSSLVTGKAYAANYAPPTPAAMTAAVSDMEVAYTDALSKAVDETNPGSAGEIGGLTLAPGVYAFTGASINVLISTDLTLNGNANDVWIFQIPGTFDVHADVVLSPGVQAKNIFWVVAGETTIFPGFIVNGNILTAEPSTIAMQTGAVLNGRALSQGAVTLNANAISLPTESENATAHGTQITLNATDPDTPDHEISGNPVVNYNIWYSQDCTTQEPTWTLQSSGVGEPNEAVELSLTHDSCHLIEYWASDGCDNVETHHYELDIVDSKAPVTTKEVTGTFIKGDNDPIDYYLGSQSLITLTCKDQSPHPVGGETLNWQIFGSQDCNNPEWQQIGENHSSTYGIANIAYEESSCHKLVYYCTDALGNAEQPQTEIDAVDLTPPVITKEIIGPQSGTCPPRPDSNDVCYLDGVTEIQVTATDSTPHPVGGVTCDWDYTVIGGEKIGVGQTGVTSPFIVHFPEESQHELTITCTDALGNEATDVETFFVDKTPPVTIKTYGEQVFMQPLLERLGNANSEWTPEQASLGTHSAKLVIPDNAAGTDFAGVDSFFDVFVDLTSINSLTYDRKVIQYDNGWTPIIIFGVDADGDGIFEAQPLEWQASGFNPSLLGDDSFIQCEATTGLTGVDTDFVNVDAYNNFVCYTPNVAGDNYDWNVYQPLSYFKSNDVGRIQTTDKVTMVKVELGGNPSAQDNEIAYVDNVRLNGDIIINEPVIWINSQTPITLTVDDAGPHKSGIKETKYRVTPVADSNCFDDSICQSAQGNEEEGWTLYDNEPFTINEQSCHLIEYYSVDNVDKTEQVKKQCVFVDNQAPETNKAIGNPKFICDVLGKCGEESDWQAWFVTSQTPVTLSCNDVQPHPVGHEQLCFKISWHQGEEISYPTQKYAGENTLTEDGYYCVKTNEEGKYTFNFLEDSLHNIEWYCKDALGNQNDAQIEWDNVDNVPPTIIVRNPTQSEASDVDKCVQSIVVSIDDAKSGVNDSSVVAELWNSEGVSVKNVTLKKQQYGNTFTYEGLMEKDLPSGSYTLIITARDNLGNENSVSVEEYLPEVVNVEYISPSTCIVDPVNGGNCDFTFNLCMRGGNTIEFWMDKLGNIVTPAMLNASTSNPQDMSWTFVGLKHIIGTDEESCVGPDVEWVNGACWFKTDAGDLSLEDMCIDITGRAQFKLHLNLASEAVQAIGEGVHDLNYWIKSSLMCEEPEPEEKHVVINEFLSGPAFDNEWIELYNPTDSNVDLANWKIHDNTGLRKTLSGTLSAGSYLVVEFNSSVLNNGGDIIKLIDNSESLIDFVSYGTWNDGNTADNADAPFDGESAGRSPNGQDTDVDNIDFVIFGSPTPGTTNI
ncbi:MAG: ice-binding family protein [Nanoarchaeota archaeon]